LPNTKIQERSGDSDVTWISKQDVVVQKKCGEEATDDTSQGTSKGVSISLLLISPLTSLPKDHFVFAAAMVPEEKEPHWRKGQ